ncbi:TonB-dependent receptor [Brevundimonas sp. Leaf363]|uniref:TonB-dependent receptor n=1 Tax=Brevundimonas sp. Leaf363 TaxID=1736353 RepID=UPI0006F4BA46|nr:TonB-dependent receptor [Brevundimonas sp. Leaf363]KQS53929.1 TonB-dependent receptor [Brevundimonas sp. Leaf363]
MRRIHTLRSTVSAGVIAAVAFGFAGAAAAQSDAPTTVDDIIVTAQKREQSLQEVPIVVTTLSQELLQNAGVRDIKDMQILTPGLTVTSTQSDGSTTIRIRGAGTVGDNPGLESSVGVVIDGVYRSRNSVGFGDLGELERIEVLKGPQGTLFGKNTSAGVVNILTARPSFTPGFEAELTGGNYGAIGGSASVTGPITDQLAGRLFIAMRERDGFYDVDLGDGPRTNTEDQDQSYWTGRGQLLLLPDDNSSIRLIADYSKREEFCCVGVQTRVGPTQPFIDALATGDGQRPPVSGFGTVPFSRTAYSNRSTPQEIEDGGVSLEANFDIPSMNATVTSISSWRDWSFQQGMDLDFTGADILYRENDGSNGYGVEALTQELRFAGTTDRFDWLVGGFASHERLYRNDSYSYGADYNAFASLLLTASIPAALGGPNPGRLQCFTNPQGFLINTVPFGPLPAGTPLCAAGVIPPSSAAPVFTPGKAYEDTYTQRSDTVALFTNNTVHLTDQFDINLGLRYTFERKNLVGRQNNLNNNGAACGGALANQNPANRGVSPIPGTLNIATPTAALGLLCLPWSNPLYDNRFIGEDFDDTDLSGTIKASYRPNDMFMFYGSYARGYKGAGYNMDRVQTGVVPDASLFFPAETVDSYELGVKSTLLDRTLLLNVTYFDQTFEDFQLNTFLGTAFVVESIPELTTRGVDADMVWFTPVEGLVLQGGVTYTDAKYGDFTASDLTNPARFPQLSLLPGGRASFAPEWSVTSSISYERSIAGLRAGFSLSGKYQTEYNTGSDLLPYKNQDAYTVVNGRISIGSENEAWTLEIWAQNLLDEEYTQVGFAAPLQGTAFTNTVTPQANGTFYNQATDTATYDAFLGAPRTYGATLRLRY